jgi:hypothetical protein
MSNWMRIGTRNYDATGRLLHRIGSVFIGLFLGIEFAHYDAPAAYTFRFFAALLGFALFYFADRRAKTPKEDTLELRAK